MMNQAMVLLWLGFVSSPLLQPYFAAADTECVRAREKIDTSLAAHQYLNQYWKCGADSDMDTVINIPELRAPWIVFDTKNGEYAHTSEVIRQQIAERRCALFPDTPTAVSTANGFGSIVHQLTGELHDFSPRLQEICPFSGFGGVFAHYCNTSQSACALPHHEECQAARRQGIIDPVRDCEESIFATLESRQRFWDWRKRLHPAQFALQQLCVYDAFFVCNPTPMTQTQRGWRIFSAAAAALGTTAYTPHYVVYVLEQALALTSASTSSSTGARSSAILFSMRLPTTEKDNDDLCTLYVGKNVTRSLAQWASSGEPTNDLVAIRFPSTLNNYVGHDNIYIAFQGHPERTYTAKLDRNLLRLALDHNINIGLALEKEKDATDASVRLTILFGDDRLFAASFHIPSDVDPLSTTYDPSLYYNTVLGVHGTTHSVTIARVCDRALVTVPNRNDIVIESAARLWSDPCAVTPGKFGAEYASLRVLSDIFTPGMAYSVSLGRASAHAVAFDRSHHNAVATPGIEHFAPGAISTYTKRGACALYFTDKLKQSFDDPNAFYVEFDFVAAFDVADPSWTPIPTMRAVARGTFALLYDLPFPLNTHWVELPTNFLPRDSTAGSTSSEFIFGCAAADGNNITDCSVYVEAHGVFDTLNEGVNADLHLTWSVFDRLWPHHRQELEIGLLCVPGIVVDVARVQVWEPPTVPAPAPAP